MGLSLGGPPNPDIMAFGDYIRILSFLSASLLQGGLPSLASLTFHLFGVLNYVLQNRFEMVRTHL